LVLIESEPKLQILALTRFLNANRYPLRSKTLYCGFLSPVETGLDNKASEEAQCSTDER
jgi:hypothetical protein